MRYDYACDKCKIIFEVKHSMKETPSIKCPKCKGPTYITLTTAPIFYIKGNGYLDRTGCRRDMDLYKLTRGQDPYRRWRQPGEADSLAHDLRKAGKFNPKPQTFLMNSKTKKN